MCCIISVTVSTIRHSRHLQAVGFLPRQKNPWPHVMSIDLLTIPSDVCKKESRDLYRYADSALVIEFTYFFWKKKKRKKKKEKRKNRKEGDGIFSVNYLLRYPYQRFLICTTVSSSLLTRNTVKVIVPCSSSQDVEPVQHAKAFAFTLQRDGSPGRQRGVIAGIRPQKKIPRFQDV